MAGFPPKIFIVLVLFTIGPFASAQLDHFSTDDLCPVRCVCSPISVKSVNSVVERWKAKCGTGGSLTSVDELQLGLYNLSNIVNLDLSDNNITTLSANVFPSADVQKLDLSKNGIALIEDGAFSNLMTLKRLDLSDNKLRAIGRSMFDGLLNVEKLKLGNNLIVQVKEGVFDGLISLKNLDLSGNPLLCNCELGWLAVWANNMSVKLSPMPKCHDPPEMRQQPLKKLKSLSTVCSWSDVSSSPLLELSPNQDQVVFEGDSLKLQCRAASSSQDTNLSWTWSGVPPSQLFPKTMVTVENRQTPESNVVESTLIIKKLHSNHTGEWYCDLVSRGANDSGSVSVIVISAETKYCPPIVTKDNKGEYFWPETIAGHVVELPCAVDSGFGFVARNNCTLAAHWLGANTTVCTFVSETTRILQQYAMMNLSAGPGSVNESAVRLHNYTYGNRASIKDPDDIVFLARTIDNYLDFLKEQSSLGTLLLELISLVMELDGNLITEAQMRDRSCTKLLSAVETIAQHQVAPFHGENMLVERFIVRRESFVGLTCTWWNSRDGHGRIFNCSTSTTTSIRIPHDKVLEASIQIPASLFHQLELRGKPSNSHQIMVSIYDNAKLFPTLFNVNRTVSSPIVGAKLVGVEVRDLVEPAYVMLGGLHQGIAPAWWDEALGDWVVPPCRPSHLLADLLVTKCHHLGYFALISDLRSAPPPVMEQARSRMSSPAVFAGTFIGGTCLLVAAFTYAICHSSIQMSDRMKHALANSWIAISALAMVFNMGIYQTEDIRVCQAIGLLLHYLTLCSLFWLAVSINGMHRSVGKLVRVVSDSSDVNDDGPGLGQPVGQPLVGLYLVGWGVSALLVGLSGAVNPMGYASTTYCALGPGPGFIPVLVPVSALFVFIFTRALMVRSAAVEKDSNAQLSEGTQATDLELLETGDPEENPTVGSLRSSVTSGRIDDDDDDNEHPPYVQLKAFLIVTALFTLSWTSGALSVIKPFRANGIRIVHEELFFSVCYAVFFIVIGAFVVFFYCFSRDDVRSVWFRVHVRRRRRNVTDVRATPMITASPASGIRQKSTSPMSAEPQDSTTLSVVSRTKPNFVDLHRRQYHNNVVTEPNTFYNPQQSIVARKFFKKQRKKRNTLNNRRQISPDNSELFHLGSKVNNTNIHVELPAPRSHDRNILNGDLRPTIDRRPNRRLMIDNDVANEPTVNNDGSVRYASVASECCSCLVSEAHSVTEHSAEHSTTDCARDVVSEHSSSSHVYATVAPDVDSSSGGGGRRAGPRMIVDPKNEIVHLKFGPKNQQKSQKYQQNNHQQNNHVKSSDEDKRETSV
ncbi:LRRCT [Nesidiocoris tenuis]|uniref:LRRCT n=1 Tax=Nesidiocoris tenuis TaxID=355587 RepID=A0ABN7BDD1_9HEMI|nr:LRRCT [Nesidiocoris tenuis]